MSRSILIASADHDGPAAAEARAALEALGYAVQSAKARTIKRAIVQSDRVVLLWSAQAAGSPMLRMVMRRALMDRKLTCVRVARDAPPALRGVRAAPWPTQRGWRVLLEKAMDDVIANDAMGPRANGGGRFGAVLTLFLLGLVTSTAFYVVDVTFAARVDALAEAARRLAFGVLG